MSACNIFRIPAAFVSGPWLRCCMGNVLFWTVCFVRGGGSANLRCGEGKKAASRLWCCHAAKSRCEIMWTTSVPQNPSDIIINQPEAWRVRDDFGDNFNTICVVFVNTFLVIYQNMSIYPDWMIVHICCSTCHLLTDQLRCCCFLPTSPSLIYSPQGRSTRLNDAAAHQCFLLLHSTHKYSIWCRASGSC